MFWGCFSIDLTTMNRIPPTCSETTEAASAVRETV